jgi:competence protein ComEA
MLLTLALFSTSMFAADAATAASPAGVVNINTADTAQLALLPHVGEKAAARIVDYRKANGSFKKTTDLMQVKGVGEKSFETLRPYLVVDGKTTLTEKQHSPRKPRASAKSSTQASN